MLTPGFAQTSEESKALREDIAELKATEALRREIEALKESQKTIQLDKFSTRIEPFLSIACRGG